MRLPLALDLVRRRLAPVAVDDSDDDAARSRYCRAVWSVLAEPGDGIAGKLVATLGPVRALEVALGASSPVDLGASELARGRERWMPRAEDAAVARAFSRAASCGARLLISGEPSWPRQLDDLGEHAPLCLWVRGDPARLAAGAASVAIVGARAATAYGLEVAAEFAAGLAASGVGVVSGAAWGIDGAAHRAALRLEGMTFALLAGGIDRPYPADHGVLLEQIARTGIVASEVPCGTAPTKWRFLMRNRLIAALGTGTVVVEAGWRSGSLNTAGHAATLGRPLGAVPGPITSAASAGCHRLFREFDAQCVTSVDDVRELIGMESTAVVAEPHARRAGGATRVRDALSTRTWRSTAEIARLSGLSVADVRTGLGLLELDGLVECVDSGWRLRRS